MRLAPAGAPLGINYEDWVTRKLWQKCFYSRALHPHEFAEGRGTKLRHDTFVFLQIMAENLLRRHLLPGLVLINPRLDDRAEVADEALHRPGGCFAEGADRMAFDLFGDVEQ